MKNDAKRAVVIPVTSQKKAGGNDGTPMLTPSLRASLTEEF